MNNVEQLVGLEADEESLRYLDSRTKEDENEERISNANLLSSLLKDTIVSFNYNPINKSVYYYYIIRSKDIDRLSKILLLRGIDVGKYVMQNCGKLYDSEPYQITEEVYDTGIQLPMHPTLSEKDIRYMAKEINQAYIDEI